MLYCFHSFLRLAQAAAISSLVFLSSQSLASSVEFALSNDMIELQWQENLGSSISAGLSLIHADVDKQKTDVLSADFFLNGVEGSIAYRMGGKLYYLNGKDIEKVEAHGLSLGGDITYNITTRFYADIGGFYSPDIINGGDFEHYTEARTSIGFKPSNNSKLYIGYRYTEATLDKYDYEPYQGIMIGFGAEF